jgi:hypothetical protein
LKHRAGLLLLVVLSAVCALVSLVWATLAAAAGSGRALAIARGYDRVGNATAGGDDGEYISSRCWRYRTEQPYRTLRALIDGAAALCGQPNHCRKSYTQEIDDARRKVGK